MPIYKQIRPQQVCTRCVMDTSDEYIEFDENGVCQRCREYEKSILPWWNYGKGHEEELNNLIAEINSPSWPASPQLMISSAFCISPSIM